MTEKQFARLKHYYATALMYSTSGVLGCARDADLIAAGWIKVTHSELAIITPKGAWAMGLPFPMDVRPRDEQREFGTLPDVETPTEQGALI